MTIASWGRSITKLQFINAPARHFMQSIQISPIQIPLGLSIRSTCTLKWREVVELPVGQKQGTLRTGAVTSLILAGSQFNLPRVSQYLPMYKRKTQMATT